MNILYVIGIASIILLFIWKKYTSYIKRRNEYIKYLQIQNQKLQSNIQNNVKENIPIDEKDESQKEDTNLFGLPQELMILLNNMKPSISKSLNEKNNCNIEEVEEKKVEKEHFDPVLPDGVVKSVKLNDTTVECEEKSVEEEVSNKKNSENKDKVYETEKDPEKKPLDYTTESEMRCDNPNLVGKCCISPILQENFADVSEKLFDIPSTSVSENDPNSNIKASNTDDNRKFLTEEEKLEDDLEVDSLPLTQSKQMHCSAILNSGNRKGEMCGKLSNKNGLCKIHNK